MDGLENAKRQVATVSQKLSSIRLIKKNTYNQLIVLQAAEVVNIVKGKRLIPLAPVPQNVVTGVWGWL